MKSTANLMIFHEIRRKFYKFHGKQQNAMANLETGEDQVVFVTDLLFLTGQTFTMKLLISSRFRLHYVNVSVLIKFSQKTSVFTLIIISSP